MNTHSPILKKRGFALSLIATTMTLCPLVHGQTTYQWNGTTDTDPSVSSNWQSSSIPPFNTSSNSRLNVFNGTNNQMIYSAAQGSTTFTSSTRGLVVGSVTSGQITLTGGTLSTAGSTNLDLLGNAGATGTLIVNGGNYVNVKGLALDFTGASTGVLTVSAGTANILAVYLANSTGSGETNIATGGSATVNLDGGILTTGKIFAGNANAISTFNFNGGTLQAGNSTTTFMGGLTVANVRNGGANIDSNGKTLTISQALVHSTVGGDNAIDGGLSKSGTGTLTLSGTNTFTGTTTISAGTLVLASTGSITNSNAVDVGSGATLDVSAVSGGFSIASGQTLKGAGTVIGAVNVASGGTLGIGSSPATLTFNNNLTLSAGSASDFQINGFTSGLFDLALGGPGSQTVSFDGTLNLNFSTGFNTEGTVKIFDFETLTGSFTSVNVTGLASGYGASFDNVTGFVTVVPEPAAWTLLTAGLTLVTVLRRRRVSPHADR